MNESPNVSILQKADMSEVNTKYQTLLTKLKDHSDWPKIHNEVQGILSNLKDISTVDAQTFFSQSFDKPLYANTRIATAKTWITKLRNKIGDDIELWSDSYKVDIVHLGGNSSNDNFS